MADTLVKASYAPTLSGSLTVDLGVTSLTNPTLTIGIPTSVAGTLTPSSSPIAATKAWSSALALSSGTYTLDMTSLPRGNLPVVDLSALTVKAIVVYNSGATNLVVAKGTTNGYFILGDTGATVTIPPKGYNVFGIHSVTGAGALAAVDGTHKTILFTGTGAATFEVSIVA